MQSDEQKGVVSGLTGGDRRASGVSPETGAAAEPLGPGQRWSASRKREAVLRLLRGEPLEVLSRELGVEIYRLEKWKQRAWAPSMPVCGNAAVTR
jgi:hypothetical protein